MPTQNALYTIFRGSTSIIDWINNADTKLTAYPNCPGCEVHLGFYEAEQSVFQLMIGMLQTALQQYPMTQMLIFTGHSLGGAMSTLMALDTLLLSPPLTTLPIRLFNFGSPRVGNKPFAIFASEKLLDRNRVTHYRDVVVHMPYHNRYMHISGEWYEDQAGVLHVCTGYEDPHCAYQWYYLTVEDHLVYLGLNMSCNAVTANTTATATITTTTTAGSDRVYEYEASHEILSKKKEKKQEEEEEVM